MQWKNEHTKDVLGIPDFHVGANVHTCTDKEEDFNSAGTKWYIEYCDKNQHDNNKRNPPAHY